MSSSAGVLQSKSTRRRRAQPCRAGCRLVRRGRPLAVSLLYRVGFRRRDANGTIGMRRKTGEETYRGDGIDRCDRPDRSPCIPTGDFLDARLRGRLAIGRCASGRRPPVPVESPGDRCSVRRPSAHKMERSPQTGGAADDAGTGAPPRSDCAGVSRSGDRCNLKRPRQSSSMDWVREEPRSHF